MDLFSWLLICIVKPRRSSPLGTRTLSRKSDNNRKYLLSKESSYPTNTYEKVSVPLRRLLLQKFKSQKVVSCRREGPKSSRDPTPHLHGSATPEKHSTEGPYDIPTSLHPPHETDSGPSHRRSGFSPSSVFLLVQRHHFSTPLPSDERGGRVPDRYLNYADGEGRDTVGKGVGVDSGVTQHKPWVRKTKGHSRTTSGPEDSPEGTNCVPSPRY